jgi:hypothetical protein
MEHIVNDCQLSAFDGGLQILHDATPEAIKYLRVLDLDLSFENSVPLLKSNTNNNNLFIAFKAALWYRDTK